MIVLPYFHKTDGRKTTSQTKIHSSTKTRSPEATIPVSVYRSNTQTVDDLTLHNYLIGVVASEMPSEFKMEALKAQAVAARTYTIDRLIGNTSMNGLPKGVKMIDTTADQVYHDPAQLKKLWGSAYTQKIKRIEQAVTATQGEIITYKGKIIQTPAFFSTSNGYTEDSQDYWENSVPYLKSVPSKWDLKSPKYKAVKKMSVKSVETDLGIQLTGSNGTVGTVISRTVGKRVAKFKIGGKVFTGRDVRESLNLRSADFTMTRNDTTITITTYGYGHGIGMSQFGANGMAKEGKSYEKILEYYYSGVKVSPMKALMPEIKNSV